MMKRFFIITVIIAGVSSFLYFWNSSSNIDTTRFGYQPNGSTYQPDPSNATFSFDGETVTLSNGRNEQPVEPGSAITEETVMMDKLAYGDINQDGKEDAALFLARYGGGSGTFIYLAAFVSGPVNYKGSEVAFIGDRIAPQSISIDGKTITVKYLDRGPNEAFSTEPTVPMSKQFIYKNGAFQ